MSEDVRWKQRLENYNRALFQLTLAAQLLDQRPLSDLEQLGLIHCFKFTHELAWNALKDYLEYEGIHGIVGSRGAVREAFKRGLIVNGEAWIDMIDKRNLSSHTYNLELAAQLAATIRGAYYPEFVALRERLEREV